MAEIICNKNRGYKWTNKKGIYFKGYLQAENGEVWRSEEAIEQLYNIDSFEKFRKYLQKIYGVFAIIIEHGSEIWLASDVAGSIPLYYTDDLKVVADDVDAIIKSDNNYDELDSLRAFELYATSYVGYNNTVYKRIKQIQIGSVCRIKNNSAIETSYYVHAGNVSDRSEETAIQELDERTQAMMKRIIAAAEGRTVVISLSGGYDSRYVACSLKDNGVDDVICYTYGREGSFEVEQSRKVANALGYKWYNVQYNDSEIRELIHEDGYLDYSNRPDYITYLQNYYAVNRLKETGMLPDNAVFITGLCNDMPTGFYIPDSKRAEQFGFSNEGAAEYNVRQRFVKFSITEEAERKYKSDILKFLQGMGISVKDYESFVSALDCIETSGFHTHCYLNMNAVHGYFGYEWLLPCWDHDMLTYWYSLSPKLRIGQYLYEKYITEHLGRKYGVGTKKHLNLSAPTPFLDKMKRICGGILVRIAYPLGIPLKRNTDVNNFAVFEVALYKAISQKKAIKADRAGIILLLTIFMMEKRYGKTWYRDIKRYLK
ncbi:asparagine synthase-related protein [Acetatifactor muris]|uniref:asparagine synthase (glutamine-hydrolyzing) n=1 Tax=Acetatifactor muris TaxID=879566 RepID=A0A2K4ZDB1_9FIRM|nr:asparagine synthase-related protein [Acetatifactor muris]MCR2046962.1 asparagine synthase-related protein [Acetatifactor muris]SOY28447.1 Carboxyethyl-arginine beta-lactam-synthase [Acetatifactor muris]